MYSLRLNFAVFINVNWSHKLQLEKLIIGVEEKHN